MKSILKIFIVLLSAGFCASCSESWTCQTKDKTMFSISESGKLGGAGKGCSCDQIRSFEMKEFGEVDEEALKKDFGC